MQKRILIPIDFSANAFNAVAYALELFKDTESAIYIYHTYYLSASTQGNPLFPVPEIPEYRLAQQSVNSEMEFFKKRVTALSNPQKHTLHFDFEYGFLLELLKSKVEKEKIDLIVMGTRGATDDKKIAYGRNAVEVMEKIRQCPVMAIPARVNFEKLNEIVFPTDFRVKWNTKELDILLTIAKKANASVNILHIGEESSLNEMQRQHKKLLETHFAAEEYSFHWMVKGGVSDGILSFVQERKGAIIAFVNRKHWFFGNIFSNPLVKSLGIHSTNPLLALHD